ncbi:PREDICTED: uncharacterized protein LOC109114647 [Nelumbo nucifera]|uniref:Uncharacterized protein LOC109114647 n=1 Tax=Nelumbo nucifera TaxID=4432 RepID=A0A1U8Q2Y7_NELNU|nr:PREDICTED: uncharacterized protein LOC109114647 [Nelumbo nucifera]
MTGERAPTLVSLKGKMTLCSSQETIPKSKFREDSSLFSMTEFTSALKETGVAYALIDKGLEMKGVDVLEECVVVYFDDILIYNTDMNSHLLHLRDVLKTLRRDQLYATTKKCIIATDRVLFLGYTISREGVSVDPKKVRAIIEWPIPKTLVEAQSFHGVANFYQRFISNFSIVMAPYTNCMKTNTNFLFIIEAERAFIEIKVRLIAAPVLALPNFKQPFEVDCDASKVGVNVVLS